MSKTYKLINTDLYLSNCIFDKALELELLLGSSRINDPKIDCLFEISERTSLRLHSKITARVRSLYGRCRTKNILSRIYLIIEVFIIGHPSSGTTAK